MQLNFIFWRRNTFSLSPFSLSVSASQPINNQVPTHSLGRTTMALTTSSPSSLSLSHPHPQIYANCNFWCSGTRQQGGFITAKQQLCCHKNKHFGELVVHNEDIEMASLGAAGPFWRKKGCIKSTSSGQVFPSPAQSLGCQLLMALQEMGRVGKRGNCS